MRRLFFVGLLLTVAFGTAPLDAAQGRIIVRVNGGLPVLQAACLMAGCTVAENIDGPPGQLYLVTTPDASTVNAVLTELLSINDVVDAEVDLMAHVGDCGTAIPPALSDTAPITYYGATVPHGYVHQPATDIVRLSVMQNAYTSATGGGVVAVIDTGVDPNHPALAGVLLPGYDFTRNQNGADETLDITLSNPPVSPGDQPQWTNGNGSGNVSQSTAAVVNQSTAAVVNGNPQYSDFGHGTMVAGVIHLTAPTAQILPLKAFHADGTGYNSDILRAIYKALSVHATVLNMSFTLAAYSREVATALDTGTLEGTMAVASAGNSDENTMVYPAGLWNVMGIASTNNTDQLSSFSNYGSQLVWAASPGEGIITTYPFGTYAAGWGTSFSAPFVSGVAAVLSGMNNLCDQISAANAVAHAKPIGADAGNGRLDVYRAIQSWSNANGDHVR